MEHSNNFLSNGNLGTHCQHCEKLLIDKYQKIHPPIRVLECETHGKEWKKSDQPDPSNYEKLTKK